MNWDADIREIEHFVQNTSLPDTLRLSPAENITDVAQFFKGHLEYVKANKNKSSFSPYLMRLKMAKDLICQSQKTI